MSKKRTVAILCGGQSAEHEVSLQSAYGVVGAIDRSKYQVIVIGIDQGGQWMAFPPDHFVVHANNPEEIALRADGALVVLVPTPHGPRLRRLDGTGEEVIIDAVFPVLHGTFAEDGTVQGLLKLVGMPFVGAGVLGSAVGMDKDVMKRLLRDAGLPIPPFLVFTREAKERISFLAVEAALGLPVFVKPCNLGSSVGIHKVQTSADLAIAVDDAFQYDRKIIIESFVKGREIECAVLGNRMASASVPGEVKPSDKHGHYSYEAKYLDPNGASLHIPAELPEETAERVRELAVKVFQVLDCEGLGRVDLFLKEDGELIVNEINTLPGFTPISMYPKLWEASGLPYTKLIDRLFQLAWERAAEENELERSLPKPP